MSLSFDFLDKRPIVIALAGSNGAGKSTFYESYLADSGLRFVNADELSASLGLLPYEAAELAASLRVEPRWGSLIAVTVFPGCAARPWAVMLNPVGVGGHCSGDCEAVRQQSPGSRSTPRGDTKNHRTNLKGLHTLTKAFPGCAARPWTVMLNPVGVGGHYSGDCEAVRQQSPESRSAPRVDTKNHRTNPEGVAHTNKSFPRVRCAALGCAVNPRCGWWALFG